MMVLSLTTVVALCAYCVGKVLLTESKSDD
jgi:hypothetical protein